MTTRQPMSRERIDFLVGLVAHHDLGGGELAGELRAALESARDVATIDAWAESNMKHHVPVATPYHSDGGRGLVLWRISVGECRAQSFPNANAVRFAAVMHIKAACAIATDAVATAEV